MGVVLGVLAIVLVYAFVLAPVIRPRRLEELEVERWELKRSDLEAQRQIIYREHRDLEFDYRMGKVSESDYQQMRRNIERRAAAVLMQLDETEGGYEQAIEDRIRSRRQAGVCPTCTATITPSARFCANCGAPLGSGER